MNYWFLRLRGTNGANGSRWTLMISDDGDPNSNWIIYNFDAKFDGGTFVNQWVDFPHLGFDNEAVYLSGNMYDVGGGFRFGKVRILWKDQIYNAQGANRGNPADCCVAHNGDVDGNGCVDDADLLRVLFAFGSTGQNLGRVDTNCDGAVDDADLLIVLFNFGSGC